jgi:DNA (cytosine-5)-methyltransferase 1
MTAPTVGSLFSGIGGLDLGLERAGMRVIWQSEIEPYCCRVLAKHWPHVPNLGNVKEIDWSSVERPDVLCGGWPCQPFSYAGNRAGADDERHLWPHMFDAIRVLRPDFMLGENVAGHLSLGFDRVLADLASIGFDAEWSLVSACSMGAPHMRERLFVVAYPSGDDGEHEVPHHQLEAGDDAVAYAWGERFRRGQEPRGNSGGTWPDRWLPEPPVRRVADGLPASVVRAPLAALGNAIVPQVAEFVGRRLMAALS